MIFHIHISYSLTYIIEYVSTIIFIEKCKVAIVYELLGQPTYIE